MTNNFIFEPSPNPKPKEKKVGGHGILCPPCPLPNCAHELDHGRPKEFFQGESNQGGILFYLIKTNKKTFFYTK